jgi:hypothetical protein
MSFEHANYKIVQTQYKKNHHIMRLGCRGCDAKITYKTITHTVDCLLWTECPKVYYDYQAVFEPEGSNKIVEGSWYVCIYSKTNPNTNYVIMESD